MVQFGFTALSVLMLASIFYLLKFSSEQSLMKKAAVLFLIWVSYVVIMPFTGLLDSLSLPPRAPLFIIFPAFAIVFISTSRKSFREVLATTHRHYPVLIQSFRILVEILIYGAFIDGFFPQRVTFEGLNYDILVGIIALPFGYLVMKGFAKSKAILVFNILGLMVLSVTCYAFISSFYFSDFVTSPDETALVQLPFIFLPGILLPIAIFYHVVSIKQCLRGD